MEPGEDETARVTLLRRIPITGLADNAVIGWKEVVIRELDRMRAEMPYADTLELRLICERTRDDS